ncbi:DUF4810 domain-containing protein [uncultured Xylophilus sp.]|uniref:DUF4810 domain-containing protein n=1 Tax=uncultured Xylophilus sp. TaxID=296832 RepID=UPI0025F21B48|nr:DUF4810 domain-containing protein [uncultured Xylophilus sp.]
MKTSTLIWTAAAVMLLSGCAQKSLYSWGGYDDMLYRQYKDPAQAAEMRTKLEAHVAQLEQNKQKAPPGVYAEIGTLYLQSNNKAKSLTYYEKERDAWPESRALMTAMINNLSRSSSSTATAPAPAP